MKQDLKELSISLPTKCVAELVDLAMTKVITYRNTPFFSPITKVVLDKNGNFVCHRKIGKTEQFLDMVRIHYINCVRNFVLGVHDTYPDEEIISIISKYNLPPHHVRKE